MKAAKASLSVAVIACDEADRIGRLLQSAAFADEIIVIDSGSRDGTQQICESAGARVLYRPWSGYAAQKQAAMDAAHSQWVLNLDADESLPAELAAEIRQALRTAGPEVAGFSMPRLSRYLGRWIRHGGWYPDRKTRLVRRGRGRWEGSGLHERLRVDGPVRPLSQPILHRVYRDISDQIGTIDRFSQVYAARRRPASGAFVWLGLLHAAGKFIECYLWKLGLLDGIAGLIIAANSAWYVFLKHAKTWEKGLDRQEISG